MKRKRKEPDDHKQLTLDEYPPDDNQSATLGTTSDLLTEATTPSQTRHEIPHSSRFNLQRVPAAQGLRRWPHDSRFRTRARPSVSVSKAMVMLGSLAKAMSLSRETREIAFEIFRKAARGGVLRGRSMIPVVGAAAYAASRISGNPLQLSEFANHLGVSRKAIGRAYLILPEVLKDVVPNPEPRQLVQRVGNLLDIPQNIRESASGILVSAGEHGLIAGRDPWGLAGAALYISSVLAQYPLTQAVLARAAGVSEVTIRNRYKELTEVLGLHLPARIVLASVEEKPPNP